MTPAADLRSLTIDIARRTAALKETLKVIVKNLPPNPGVRPLTKNSCVVSSSEVMKNGNWSPAYWLNADMGKALCEIIDRSRPENLRRNIVTILRRGSYETGSKQRQRIHPAALRLLRHAWIAP